MKTQILFITGLLVYVSCIAQSKLIFKYDTAGNQIQYKYCEGSDCNTDKSVDTTEIVKEIDANDKLLLNSFSLFPNPTHGDISLQWSSISKRKLEKVHLIDFSGKVLTTKINFIDGGAELHLEQLPTGVYFARFQFDDATMITKKILKN
ncbi:T9SS type A sorting domain-containing protein [Aquimarina sp. U1-2]|uniref:T9SS type A sorting domain-containing protein n=1 Tax=Aquimarina sp. U1-2 TaxID=2823141 RepID=UPI001AECC7DF|nr:T9SS type A sorting domain-containing protein [Aquimarina sp. U1-2]MBP2831951.1 T9SS type A sorting domain-containing protein [Aquimarina sp. U1-2]